MEMRIGWRSLQARLWHANAYGVPSIMEILRDVDVLQIAATLALRLDASDVITMWRSLLILWSPLR